MDLRERNKYKAGPNRNFYITLEKFRQGTKFAVRLAGRMWGTLARSGMDVGTGR